MRVKHIDQLEACMGEVREWFAMCEDERDCEHLARDLQDAVNEARLERLRSLGLREEGEGRPWSFTVVIDPAGAAAHGLDPEGLCGRIDSVASRRGMARVAPRTWCVAEGHDEVASQCGTLLALSKADWLVGSVSALRYYEDDAEPNDFMKARRPAEGGGSR